VVQVLAVQFGEQLAERDALLAAVQLGCDLEQQPLTGVAVAVGSSLELADVDRSIRGQAGSRQRCDPGRAECVVDGAVCGVEGDLCCQPARERPLVALEPRVQVSAATAELAELLVRLCRQPPVLVGAGGTIGRLGPRPATAAR
jgi:hypothetical protein